MAATPEISVPVLRLKTALQDGDALIIDVREPSEYRYERVDGVRNIPSGDLARELSSIPIMRQVQIVAGGLALLGALAPGMRWLSGLVGAGLLFAGLSGTCMMAHLLARMPWNRGGGCEKK